MSQSLANLFQTVEVGEPQQAGSLQVFGLRWPVANGLTYQTLDEALAAGDLDVTEISDSGSVPTLKVVNKGETLVFLMAGEQLIGAKQNRVLNASILVGGKTELPIPVSCVEAGRWRYHSPKFAASGTSSHGMLRKMMSMHAHEGYRLEQRPSSKQGEVWSEVARKLDKLKSSSPSGALHQAYDDHHKRLDEMLGKLEAPADAFGAVFLVNGRIAGVDLFDRPSTLTKLWPKLVRAYALDAIEEEKAGPPVEGTTVQQWLRSAAGAKAEPFPSPGLGQDVRLEGEAIVGAGLVVDDHPVHVELFTREPTR